MWEELVTVANFGSETEARCELERLNASGIKAVLRMDNCGGMRPHLDLHQGVQLMVPTADADGARELLSPSTDSTGATWVCPACTETGEASFDACWSCGAPRP